LALKDLFKGSSAYLEILSKYIYAKLVDDNALNITLDTDWVTKGTDPLESNFKHFLFTNGGLIILFEKYQIGPAFIGEPKIIIPFETFTAHIELKETIDDIVPSTEAETTTSVEVITETPSIEMSNETTEIANSSENEPNSNQEVVPAKRVALTFEDGPDPNYTPLILDTLKSRNQVATFFVQGIRAKEYPGLIQRINAEGHLIGNHTWSHPQLTHLSPEDMQLQLQKTQNILEQITGRAPFLYRPSYGIYNENVISTINMPAILWSVDPEDLKYKDASYITNYVLDHVTDGAIILLHDTNAYTTQAISAILDALIAEGYEIVTVDELLGITENTAKYNVRIFSQAVETH
jgi:peptidoglycan/xylan/chitin deacetylase (PgdA/CDA1 family)